jgi:3-hydroxyisobutyrate dehydrogenase-like beta-hydroxyacid dehydrogenase
MTETIGFIGLGNIGAPAVANLLAEGFHVTGYDVRPNAALAAAGMVEASSLKEIAACDLIIQSLPNATAMRECLQGLMPHLRAGQAIADISSYALDDKTAAARLLDESGITMLDCEISGLPFQVAARTAVLFCAGDRSTVQRFEMAFSAFSARQFHLGPFGAATKMKLIANFMVCAHNLIAAEALNLGAATGLDKELMVDVLKPSAAGSATFSNKAPLMVSREFSGGRGPFRHMFGYLARAKQLALDHGLADATPVLDRIRSIYATAEAESRHDQDIAAIIEVVESLATRKEVP